MEIKKQISDVISEIRYLHDTFGTAELIKNKIQQSLDTQGIEPTVPRWDSDGIVEIEEELEPDGLIKSELEEEYSYSLSMKKIKWLKALIQLGLELLSHSGTARKNEGDLFFNILQNENKKTTVTLKSNRQASYPCPKRDTSSSLQGRIP